MATIAEAAVVTLWHFSVPTDDGTVHACVPAPLADMALAGLQASGTAWNEPTVRLEGSWVVDGVRYRCRPRRNWMVIWVE